MKHLAIAAVLCLIVSGISMSATPQMLNYQGQLTDNIGDPVADGSYSVVFTIYDASVAGTSVWTETQNVNTSGGLFAVLLGSVSPVLDTVFNGTTRYLGIAIAGDPELTPRTAMVSVPYAQRVSTVDGASGGNITSKVSIGLGHTLSGDSATITGGIDNTASGNYSVVSGGILNVSSGARSVIGGGANDTVIALYGGVGSGYSNLAGDATTDTAAYIGGGYDNTAIGQFSTVSGGKNNTADSTWATVGGGGFNLASGENSTIGGGLVNSASGISSIVSGGQGNTASASRTTVGGGFGNTASALSSTISGGSGNTASGTGSCIGGGSSNTSSEIYAVIGGGLNNRAIAGRATIGGGEANIASGLWSTVGGGEQNSASRGWSTIGGGVNNIADSPSATVSGGASNTANGDQSTVSGGSDNIADGEASVVGGGESDTATGDFSTVAGGRFNRAGDDLLDTAAFVGGGMHNKAIAGYSTVSGGRENMASGTHAVVGGGLFDTASGFNATVAGGGTNMASGSRATVGGGGVNTSSGDYATVGGGRTSTASGDYATVPGGRSCVAAGLYSFATGRGAKANHDGTFVWGDGTNANFASTGTNQFLIRATGGVGIGTNSPQARLHIKGTGFPSSFGYFDTEAVAQDAGIRFNEAGSARSHLFHAAGANTLNLFGDGFSGISIDASGDVGIGTNSPKYKLDVRGTIGNNATLHHSDRRWKDNIVTLNKSLDKVQQLRGVSFDWRRKEFTEMNFPEGKQIGLIAQEVEQVIPELVNTDDDGYKSVDYSKLVALLIEANKEQQKQIDELKELVEQFIIEGSNTRFGQK